MEALQRRAQGQGVGPVSEVNPPTMPGPGTMPTPPATMPTGSPTAPQTGAGGVSGAIPGKDVNDAKIIEALISYLRKKVL